MKFGNAEPMRRMSALGQKADMCGALGDVRQKRTFAIDHSITWSARRRTD